MGATIFFYPIFSPECQLNSYIFSIYNRWGQQVFTTHDIAAKWNGTYSGIKADLGTYMYYIYYEIATDHSKHIVKGDVTLIR